MVYILSNLVNPLRNTDPLLPEGKQRSRRSDAFFEHADGLASLYAHLSEINVKEGDRVDTRTVIGKMGRTGNATGDHLHLEVYKNGRPVNPISILPKR